MHASCPLSNAKYVVSQSHGHGGSCARSHFKMCRCPLSAASEMVL